MEKKQKTSKEEFGYRLKKVRSKNKLSQEALGKILGYKNPRSDISNLENGRKYPSIDKLIALAQNLSISIDYLLLGKKDPFKNEIKSIDDLNSNEYQ